MGCDPCCVLTPTPTPTPTPSFEIVTEQLVLSGPVADVDALLNNDDIALLTEIALGQENGLDIKTVLVEQQTIAVEREADENTQISTDAFEDETSIIVGQNFVLAAPWDIEASPWDIEASPDGTTVAHPFAETAGEQAMLDPAYCSADIEEDGEAVFSQDINTLHHFPWSQWVFGSQYGINLYQTTGDRVPTTSLGAGIKVLIFDTSPFVDEGEKFIPGIAKPIIVRHPTRQTADVALPAQPTTDDHGFFIASLIAYIAPEADIELIRLLNNEGRGDTSTLYTQLAEVIEREGNDGNNDLSHLVINFSFGFAPSSPNGQIDPALVNEQPILDLLQSLMQDAVDRGAVFVAASGNQTRTPGERFGSTIPAVWPQTIDVAGRDLQSELACYSNAIITGTTSVEASIPAPAGNGFVDQPGDICASAQQFCSTRCGYQCPYGLTGYTTEGYGFWTGTSFATAIVSGVITLVREACPNATQEAIRSHIRSTMDAATVEPGWSRLNVETILASCPP